MCLSPPPRQFSTALAIERTEEWQKEALSIQHCLPGNHPVLQACLRAIGNFQKYLPLLLKLGSSFLKLSCWKEIFAGEVLLLGVCVCGGGLGLLLAGPPRPHRRADPPASWAGSRRSRAGRGGSASTCSLPVMGVKCPLNMQFTLGQLLSYPLLEHSEAIFRVSRWAGQGGRGCSPPLRGPAAAL